MAVLKAEPLTSTQRQQLALIVVDANRALASFAEPLRQMRETINSMTEPLHQMGESFNKSMLPMIRAFAESHKNFYVRLNTSLNFNVSRLKEIETLPPYISSSKIIDGEVDQENEIESTKILTPLPSISSIPKNRAKMGLKQISGGNFSHRRKTLKGLSMQNKEGRLLGLLLSNQDLFISDEIIREKFYVEDIMDFSHVVKNLRNKFKLNGLIINIKRQGDPTGYILISIDYLH